MSLLHVFVGDAQLDAVPKDMLQLRLVLSGDVRQGGREFSVSSNWKEGSIVRFQHTQVMGQAADKAQSTIHFSLRGTLRSSPGTEETLGEAVLSTYAMEKADAKIVSLLPPGARGGGRASAPVGRLTVTLFLNRFAIDFNAENEKAHYGKVSALDASAAQVTAATSSREYAFLLNRRLNWKGDKSSSWNKKIESKLNEDMNGHMKELRTSKQHVDAVTKQHMARKKNVKSEPKLAYGTQHAPPPPKAQFPTRCTNMAVGFVAAWPKPSTSTQAAVSQEQLAERLRIAEERRLLKAEQEAASARNRAHNARVKADEARLFLEQQRNEDELRRLSLQVQQEAVARLKAETEREKRRTAAMAVRAHFQESAMRTRVREMSQEREKKIYMKAVLRATTAADAATSVAKVRPYGESTKVKVPVVKMGRPKVALTAWAAKQRRRADRARRVRERLSSLRTQLAQGTASEADAAALLAGPLAFVPRKRFMQSIGKMRLRVPIGASVSDITASILSVPAPPPKFSAERRATAAAAAAAAVAPPPPAPAPALTSSQIAEAAAARALERYRLAMHRRQESSLQKIARSSLYGPAHVKGSRETTINSQGRSHSAPPSSRVTQRDWAAVEAGVVQPSMRLSVLQPTQSSRLRHATGGCFSDFELETQLQARSRKGSSSKLRSQATDDTSVNTETLMREFSREIFHRSSEARAARTPTRSVSVNVVSRRPAAPVVPGPKPPLPFASARKTSRIMHRTVPPADRQTPSRPSSTAPFPKRVSAATSAIATAWRKEARSVALKMARKSELLKSTADDFALRGDLDTANALLQQGNRARGGNSGSIVPGFLSSFNEPDAVAVSARHDGSGSHGSSVDRDVDRIVSSLMQQQQQAHGPQISSDQAASEAEEQARVAAIIHALESQGVEVESRLLEKVKELRLSSPARTQAVTIGGPEGEHAALSPMSNLKATLREGMFGDGE